MFGQYLIVDLHNCFFGVQAILKGPTYSYMSFGQHIKEALVWEIDIAYSIHPELEKGPMSVPDTRDIGMEMASVFRDDTSYWIELFL